VKQWWTKRTDIKIVTDEVIGEALTAWNNNKHYSIYVLFDIFHNTKELQIKKLGTYQY
jgi:phosphatidylglycerophosphatase A